jgi:hypothetical protein
MQELIKSGSILFREGTPFPEGFQMDSASYSPGWRSVTGMDGYSLDRQANGKGWRFFYFAGEIGATVFGSEGQKTVRKALKQILADQKMENFNSLEVTSMVFKHFLGLPYATISFHKRNIQEGMFLQGSKDPPERKNERVVAT